MPAAPFGCITVSNKSNLIIWALTKPILCFKGQHQEREMTTCGIGKKKNKLVNLISDKGLESRLYKNCSKSIIKDKKTN